MCVSVADSGTRRFSLISGYGSTGRPPEPELSAQEQVCGPPQGEGQAEDEWDLQ